jgi:hypothetical protein
MPNLSSSWGSSGSSVLLGSAHILPALPLACFWKTERTMINALHPYSCEFCGEENEVFVDASGMRTQKFTEDCTVCCRPNLLTIRIEHDGEVSIEVEREYDA